MYTNINLNIILDYVPFVIGGICALKQIKKGHDNTKKDDIIINVSSIFISGVTGYTYGYIYGGILCFFWPITLPVLCLRAYERRKIDYSILFGE